MEVNGKKIGKDIIILKEIQNDINKNKFEIGKILNNIKESKEYILLGYKNLIEFAKNELSLGKNQIYNLISIYIKFSNNEKFSNYSYSQLSEMISVPDELINEITINYSVKDIRELKNKLNTKKEECKEIPNKESLKKHETDEVMESLKNEINELESKLVAIKLENQNYKKIIDKFLSKDIKGNFIPKWIIPEQQPIIESESDFTFNEVKGILLHLKNTGFKKPFLFKRALDKAIYYFEHLKVMEQKREEEAMNLYIQQLTESLNNIENLCKNNNLQYKRNEELSYIQIIIYNNNLYKKEDLINSINENIIFEIIRSGSIDKIILDKY